MPIQDVTHFLSLAKYTMKISQAGINLIKSFEAFRSKPYLPTPNDVPTIGYGSTYYEDGTRVKLTDASITESHATDMLVKNLSKFEEAVNKNVKIVLTQNQFDALCSFVYNIGIGNFSSSTLLKKLNANDIHGAADQFLVWNKQAGKVLNGLVTRRNKERTLFLS